MTVRELVAYGRHPRRRLLVGARAGDDAAVDAALVATGLVDLATRDDEPTTFLDIRYQLDVLRMLRSVTDERGLTVVAVLHDLNQAAEFADRVLLLADGAVVASAAPAEVLTAEHIRRAFAVDVEVALDASTGVPHCRFPGRTRPADPHRPTHTDRPPEDLP